MLQITTWKTFKIHLNHFKKKTIFHLFHMYDLFVNFDLKYNIFTISEKNNLPYKPIVMKNYTLFFLNNSRTGLFSTTYSKQTTAILYVDKNTKKKQILGAKSALAKSRLISSPNCLDVFSCISYIDYKHKQTSDSCWGNCTHWTNLWTLFVANIIVVLKSYPIRYRDESLWEGQNQA